MTVHPISPVYDENSELLILGSFPSVRSRESGFFYGHPQNRFWKVLAAVYEARVPCDIPEKKAFLLSHGIALWDVIASCDITGSADSSIRNAKANDIASLLKKTNVRTVYCNGGTAKRLFDRFLLPKLRMDAVLLPSTSPANAAYSLERLIEAWRVIRRDNIVRHENFT